MKSEIIEDINQKGVFIKFQSPQLESEWDYSILDKGKNLILQQESPDKNIFLEATVRVFFSFLKTIDSNKLEYALDKKILQVHIFNDKEFYSQTCIKTPHEKFPIFQKKHLKKTGFLAKK